jgi:hypothetical protein
MADKFQHLLERNPKDRDTILGLVEASPAFRDLAERHHEVSEELHRLPQPEAASDADGRQRLEHRQRDLEEQLVLMMNNATRV